MSPATAVLQPAQTAVSPHTIWSDVGEDDFRRHLVALEERTNAVPVDVLEATVDATQSDQECLPVELEKQVADDLAFIAAVTEGAQSVAAVCLEQFQDGSNVSLVIKVAGMDVVDNRVRAMLTNVTTILVGITSETHSDDDTSVTSEARDEIFKSVVYQHRQKLLGRLRSKKWTKPKYLSLTHKKSLWQDFDNVVHRVQHIYPKGSEKRQRVLVERQLASLRKVYYDFESTVDDQCDEHLQSLVKATYDFCRFTEIQVLAHKLGSVRPTSQIAAALKTLHQLEKIGAYWRISVALVTTAREYNHVFRKVALQYLTPYTNVPTSIAYESWAKTCHVHAEIQLVVDYVLQAAKEKKVIRPRTIGTSKYLCYLCYLFLTYHGSFSSLNTHGRLYDQWTVPDLESYDEQTRKKLAGVLKQMDEHICKQTEEIDEPVWRAEPMTSRQNLLALKGDEEAVTVVMPIREKNISR